MEVYFSMKIEWTFVIMIIKDNKEESCFKVNICDIIVKVDIRCFDCEVFGKGARCTT